MNNEMIADLLIMPLLRCFWYSLMVALSALGTYLFMCFVGAEWYSINPFAYDNEVRAYFLLWSCMIAVPMKHLFHVD